MGLADIKFLSTLASVVRKIQLFLTSLMIPRLFRLHSQPRSGQKDTTVFGSVALRPGQVTYCFSALLPEHVSDPKSLQSSAL
ncbi:hypothetical protein, partial [Serratia marcescens]|uniref:hypothetical protein n=1 Tax=Serratia marcescens TaxID=615 RepID=UPI0019D6B37A